MELLDGISNFWSNVNWLCGREVELISFRDFPPATLRKGNNQMTYKERVQLWRERLSEKNLRGISEQDYCTVIDEVLAEVDEIEAAEDETEYVAPKTILQYPDHWSDFNSSRIIEPQFYVRIGDGRIVVRLDNGFWTVSAVCTTLPFPKLHWDYYTDGDFGNQVVHWQLAPLENTATGENRDKGEPQLIPLNVPNVWAKV